MGSGIESVNPHTQSLLLQDVGDISDLNGLSGARQLSCPSVLVVL